MAVVFGWQLLCLGSSTKSLSSQQSVGPANIDLALTAVGAAGGGAQLVTPTSQQSQAQSVPSKYCAANNDPVAFNWHIQHTNDENNRPMPILEQTPGSPDIVLNRKSLLPEASSFVAPTEDEAAEALFAELTNLAERPLADNSMVIVPAGTPSGPRSNACPQRRRRTLASHASAGACAYSPA